MTLKMTSAQVVITSVNVNNSSFQNYTNLDDHTQQTNYFTIQLFNVQYRSSIHMTLKMTSAQVVITSVNVNKQFFSELH